MIQEVEGPRIFRNRHKKVARSLSLRTSAFHSREDPWYSLLLNAESPQGHSTAGSIGSIKNLKAPTGIELATFRLVVPQPTALPHIFTVLSTLTAYLSYYLQDILRRGRSDYTGENTPFSSMLQGWCVVSNKTFTSYLIVEDSYLFGYGDVSFGKQLPTFRRKSNLVPLLAG